MKLRTQLFIVFLILGITAGLLISILIYYREKKIILGQVHSNLETISQTKKNRLEGLIKNKFEEFAIISESPFISEQMETYSKTGNKKYRLSVDSLLKVFQHTVSDFHKLHITDSLGKIIASSDSTFIGKDFSNEESFLKVKETGKYLDRFYVNKDKELCITAALEINKNIKQGTLIFELKANDFINLTNDYTGLGESGETILIKLYQQPVVLTPTRFITDAPFKPSIPLNDPKYGLNIALEGKEGIIENVLDYRNKEIIASTRYIKDLNWGMLTKIDYDEAYDSINSLRNFLIIFNTGFIFFTLVTSYFIGRFLAGPVEALILSTNKISEGELHSRVRLPYHNELGVLAESFNTMAERLEKKMNEMEKIGYMISHDLRAPLNSIIPLADFIKEDNKGKLSGETEQMLDMIKSKSLQMNDLIKGLTESTIPNKTTQENIDLDSLVGSTISNLNPPSNIQMFIQHNLPLIYFHKQSLAIIFQNLLQNAIQSITQDKGIINIGYSDEPNHFKFWVSDNGAVHNKIYFSDTQTPKQTVKEIMSDKLEAAKKIIESNGGRLWMEYDSIETKTTYFFTITK